MENQVKARIFSTILIFSMLLGAVGAPAAFVKAASTITFSGEELLARPTATSITINVVPDENISLYYEYGTSSGGPYTATSTVSATAGEPCNVIISGLSPDTQYYYRMQYQKPGDVWVARTEHSFHTQRASGDTFTFTIIADSHMNGGLGDVSLYQQTLANVAAEKPDFHIDLGDTFWTDGVTSSATANQRFLAQRQWMSAVSSSSAIFVTPGNHENEEGWNFDDANSLALISLNARKRYYPDPIPDPLNDFYSANPDTLAAIDGDHFREDYFAWEWGDALFVFIDPYQYTMTKPYSGTAGGEVDDEGPGSLDNWDWTLGQQQFEWFKNTIEKSHASYKFVFAHHMVGGLPAYYYVRGGAEAANLYEWGGYNSDGTTWGFDTERPGWGGIPVHQLMIANGVSAFFYGHDHEYAYQARDGVVYQLVPSPSMTGYGFGLYSESDPHTIKVLPNSGHLRVTVDPSQATVDYIGTSSGTVNYSYTIAPAVRPYDLTTAVSPAGGGTIDPAAGVHSYTAGTVINVTATPASGYIFDHWSGACSGSGACQVTMNADASVTADFAVLNVAPVAADDTYGANTDIALNVSAPGVLGNDTDINSDPLTASKVSDPTHGELAFNSDGSFTYTPDNGFTGEDTFTYKANDGALDSNSATVTIMVNEATHSIPLVSGWNLVSFNVHPTSTAVADVLKPVAGNFSLVYAWNAAAGSWRRYDPNVPVGNTLTSLDESMGFWIKINTAATLVVGGSVPGTSNIPLATGWNLVGFPSSTNLALPDAFNLHGVSDFSLAYAYHAIDTGDPWKKHNTSVSYGNDLTELAPGWGYWVDAGAACTWDVSY